MAIFRSKKGTVGVFVIIFAVMMALGAVLGGHLNSIFFESVQTKETKGKTINILFMGIDARNAKENSRSDTMIVASIDPDTQKVAMVSIPRDTRIKNSAGRYDKINGVNYLEGPEAACRQVSKLLDVPVDYYVVTNFGGFGDIVDALGGVHINVEENMRHADPVNPALAINISKGYQYLDGKQALAFVRYRGGATADIGRTENQQKFIKALAAEMMQSKTILKLPQLIPEIKENVRTNLPLQDMIYLANMAQKLDMENIAAQTLPGYFYHDSITGASYWEADKKIAGILMDSLLKGESFPVMSEAPPGARPAKTNPVSAAVAQQQAEMNQTPVEIPSDAQEPGTERPDDDPNDTAVGDTKPGDNLPDNQQGDGESAPVKPEPEQSGDEITNPVQPDTDKLERGPGANTPVPEIRP